MRTIRDIERELRDAGFIELRTSGSHRTFGHEDGRRIMVPVRSSATEGSPVAMRNLQRDLKRVLSGERLTRAGGLR